jgi:hypothetical protein
MKITTIGIDLAKAVFQVHGVDGQGKAVLRKQLKRDQMAPFFAALPPCLIGMEACGSAHHWARKLQGFGHTVRLMAPQFVKPYVKTNKNDAADAAKRHAAPYTDSQTALDSADRKFNRLRPIITPWSAVKTSVFRTVMPSFRKSALAMRRPVMRLGWNARHGGEPISQRVLSHAPPIRQLMR